MATLITRSGLPRYSAQYPARGLGPSLGAQTGFTLVEVMVALAVLSLIMLTTVTGFRTLGNTASTLERMTDRTDELRSVSSFLRDALENSVVGSGAKGDAGLSFGGVGGDAAPVAFFRLQWGSLEWRSKLLFGEAYGGGYFLRLFQQGERIVLQWQDPMGRDQPLPWTGSPSRDVLEGVELFEIWHREAPGRPWVQGNIDRNAPGHVKLVIKANGRFWPELIMAVQR